ncbi:MAG: twin-arginine translocase subunit TatC [Candidatus Thermoplasmatota archaeon]|nr:twin-arginine translocase subunit TatC [Candidatus Thermoplasmatota archaeon]
MRLRLSRDVERPIQSHIDELASRGTAILFVLSVAIIIWWQLIDSLLEAWLAGLPLGAAEGSVTIYNLHGWMGTRWSMIGLFSLLTILPFVAHQILAFADEGLLPSERKWLRTVTIGGVSLGLSGAILWWLWLYPLAIEYADISGGIEGIGAQYDASMLFDVAIGISWWIFLSTIGTIALVFARLLSLVSTEPFDPLRVRVHGTLMFIWWIAAPEAIDGIWLILAVLLLIIPETIILTMPSPMLSKNARRPSDVYDAEGAIRRRIFTMCHCEGACPKVSFSSAPMNVGWTEVGALCLSADERDALLDSVVRNRATDLIISGCNGTPLPYDFQESLRSASCNLSGLEWLDKPDEPSMRESELSKLY